MQDSLRLALVDAFASEPLSGNAAAVCLLNGDWPSEERMQKFAAEMNQSETAFVLERKQRLHLRWFTPNREVDLCGHATRAAAKALWNWRVVPSTQSITFESRSGSLPVALRSNQIVLDFPITPATELTTQVESTRELLLQAFNNQELEIQFLGASKFDLLVVLDSDRAVRNLKPNFSTLEKIEYRGIIVTARDSTQNVDFVSRFFAPRCSINEDPVTGSAHCCLADYWGLVLGESTLKGYQASARGGTVGMSIDGDRVSLAGEAHLVFDTKIPSKLLY